MMIQEFTLDKYDWHVKVYYAVDSYYADEILDDLIEIGCEGEQLTRAKRNLWSGNLDTGLTFSNKNKKTSVIVIGLASTPKQYANSIAHEVRHLESSISEVYGIDTSSEEVCYLTGEIHEQMWTYTHTLLCPQCKLRIRKIIIV